MERLYEITDEMLNIAGNFMYEHNVTLTFLANGLLIAVALFVVANILWYLVAEILVPAFDLFVVVCESACKAYRAWRFKRRHRARLRKIREAKNERIVHVSQ